MPPKRHYEAMPVRLNRQRFKQVFRELVVTKWKLRLLRRRFKRARAFIAHTARACDRMMSSDNTMNDNHLLILNQADAAVPSGAMTARKRAAQQPAAGAPRSKGAKGARHEEEEHGDDEGSQHWALGVRAASCDPCGQNTHAFDRRCQKSYLWWPKTEKVKNGHKVPMGKECGFCNYVRKKYYPTGTSQADVNEAKSTAEGGARHEMLREDRASGANKMQAKEAANIKAATVTGQRAFDEAFAEGTFEPLWSFASDRNLDFDSEEELVHYITHSLGFQCGPGKYGDYGVFVTEGPKGSYRFRRGLADLSEIHKKESHENGEDAEEQHAENSKKIVGDFRTARLMGTKTGGILSSSSDLSPRGSHCPSFDFPPSAAAGAQAHRGDADDTSSLLSVQSRRRSVRAPTEGSPATPCFRSKAAPTVTDKKKKLRVSDGAVDAGRKLLEEVKENWTCDILWNKKYRARDFENLLTRISAKASKVSTVMGDESAASIAEDLFQASVDLEESRAFVAKLRDSPEQVVDDIGKRGASFIKNVDDLTKANILSTTMFALLGSKSVETQALGVRLARFRDDPGVLSIAILRDAPAEFQTTCQHNLVQAFTDKLIQKGSQQEFMDVMKAADATIGPCDMDSIDPSIPQIDPSTGWAPSALADLHAIRYFSHVAATDSKDKLPRSLKNLGIQLTNNKDKLSSRLRVCMRVSAGTVNWAKAGWDRLSSASGAGEANVTTFGDDAFKSVSAFVACISDMCHRCDNQEGPVAVWTLLSEYMSDDAVMENIQALAKYIDGLDDTGETKDGDDKILALKDRVRDILYESIGMAMGFFNYFSMDIDGIYTGNEGFEDADADADADPFRVLSKLAWVILLFDVPPAERNTIKEMKSRCDLIVSANEVKIQSASKPMESGIVMWSEVWQQESSISCSPRLPEASRGALPFQEFNNRMACRPVSRPIVDYVTRAAASDGCSKMTPKFLQVAVDLKNVLPVDVQTDVAACQAYNLIKGAASSAPVGKMIGCMQATSVLKSFEDLRGPIADKAEVGEWREVIIKEWSARFAELLKKLDCEPAQKFVDKCRPAGEDIMSAISAWTFHEAGSPKTWLASSARDLAREQQFKAVEFFVPSLPTSERTVEELKMAKSSLTWMSPLQAAQLDELVTAVPVAKDLAKTATLIMASCVMTNSILTKIGKAETKRYVLEKLAVRKADLPEKLVAAMDASPEESSACADAGAAPGAASEPAPSLDGAAAPKPKGSLKAPKLPPKKAE
ncbi:unnamed protein product, partial [Prorocentrum cordatum]